MILATMLSFCFLLSWHVKLNSCPCPTLLSSDMPRWNGKFRTSLENMKSSKVHFHLYIYLTSFIHTCMSRNLIYTLPRIYEVRRCGEIANLDTLLLLDRSVRLYRSFWLKAYTGNYNLKHNYLTGLNQQWGVLVMAHSLGDGIISS